MARAAKNGGCGMLDKLFARGAGRNCQQHHSMCLAEAHTKKPVRKPEFRGEAQHFPKASVPESHSDQDQTKKSVGLGEPLVSTRRNHCFNHLLSVSLLK